MNLTTEQSQKLALITIGNGMIVLLIGLIAGLMLIFSLLGAVTIWPLPVWDITVPGSTRGWVSAHVGGILNGVMISVFALIMKRLNIIGYKAFWIGWGMIITGWANTVFYWAGNLSENRGLSMVETPFGQPEFFGITAFLVGAIGMIFTFVSVILLAIVAFERAKNS